ncbi:hypothetical protein N7540_009349 [Penicillium herquei]|nr:hypothetical protein N7540_009349 [Penicillium herquei]
MSPKESNPAMESDPAMNAVHNPAPQDTTSPHSQQGQQMRLNQLNNVTGPVLIRPSTNTSSRQGRGRSTQASGRNENRPQRFGSDSRDQYFPPVGWADLFTPVTRRQFNQSMRSAMDQGLPEALLPVYQDEVASRLVNVQNSSDSTRNVSAVSPQGMQPPSVSPQGMVTSSTLTPGVSGTSGQMQQMRLPSMNLPPMNPFASMPRRPAYGYPMPNQMEFQPWDPQMQQSAEMSPFDVRLQPQSAQGPASMAPTNMPPNMLPRRPDMPQSGQAMGPPPPTHTLPRGYGIPVMGQQIRMQPQSMLPRDHGMPPHNLLPENFGMAPMARQMLPQQAQYGGMHQMPATQPMGGLHQMPASTPTMGEFYRTGPQIPHSQESGVRDTTREMDERLGLIPRASENEETDTDYYPESPPKIHAPKLERKKKKPKPKAQSKKPRPKGPEWNDPNHDNGLCEFSRPCGMTASPDGLHYRKVVSHFFGRNKASTKLFPDFIWVHYCRKHYQRARYRAAEWPFTQCELLLESLARMEEWGGVEDFELTLRRREVKRVASEEEAGNADQLSDGGEGDEEPEEWSEGEGEGDPTPAPATAAGRRHPVAQVAPVPDWLRQSVGRHMSFDDIRHIVHHIVQHMRQVAAAEEAELEASTAGTPARPRRLLTTRVRFPDIEILPSFRQWVLSAGLHQREHGDRGEEEESGEALGEDPVLGDEGSGEELGGGDVPPGEIGRAGSNRGGSESQRRRNDRNWLRMVSRVNPQGGVKKPGKDQK